MIKRNYIVFLIIFFSIAIFFVKSNVLKKQTNQYYIGAASSNPGEIFLYKLENGNYKKIKSIDTGYKFVYTVRVADIYNNKRQYIVAGVSNIFFGEPYGCKIISYDLYKFQEKMIDYVGDLRCKDLTIGDAENNGKNEIVLATHGLGYVRLYKWQNNQWEKEDLDSNYIDRIDQQEKTDHRVPNTQLPCQSCIVQTAVHIVKIADVDNDGKNEVIATISSPLELQNVDEISVIKVYKKEGDTWKSTVVDKLSGREFRSITIGDLYNNRHNIMLIGIGSPRNEKGSLVVYDFFNSSWNKKEIYRDSSETNMKAGALADVFDDGKQRILLATGFPEAKIMLLTWKINKFEINQFGTISSLFNIKGAQFNSMAVSLQKDPVSTNLIIGGMTTYPNKKIGWEGTKDGFIAHYKMDKNLRTNKVIETRSVLGLDKYTL